MGLGLDEGMEYLGFNIISKFICNCVENSIAFLLYTYFSSLLDIPIVIRLENTNNPEQKI
jgi:hypothetical protein